ncbi:bifunctional UDP-N-acetylglucosamine diphosphorylase/glucosamine-1-phosphate N-acetyltransferase GlmU [Salinicoccus kekensis]|uniref:Bifunctional protein GlmU n=1 Tax=Salinicoccus kekensis TaxID=714307 RepID=A0A285UMN0_9STAP|nr:bifunctional UDP-N-acetylglucosamine diphosphorylase/glucosamine-1-phosphate N-acetyltransferase GlmU [Salinicoccus kekensis]SOC43174.1 bifunctional UDP-N-acetylglucosamine pyrophosphorylase/glucosamine-1-phosphate N-acetyltransferase [Salinicoccus kekensis]
MQTRAIILAAGKGTRMKSRKAKVLHELCGLPMIQHVINNVKEAGFDEVHTIIGPDSREIGEYLGDSVEKTVQDEQLGTAHAVGQLSDALAGKEGHTLVIYGDTPLISPLTIKNLLEFHKQRKSLATILSAEAEVPTGYGRVVRNYDGSVKRIVEEKDATSEVRELHEINTGTFIFDNKTLFKALDKVTNDNAQKEYHLPEVISIMFSEHKLIDAYETADFNETMGIHDRVALAKAEAILREQINTRHMQNGVSFTDPKSTYVDATVKIGMDTLIYPGVVLSGDTVIGENVTITSSSHITDSHIEDDAVIKQSVVSDAKVGKGTTVGPFAQLRPGAELGKNVKIGNFVEVKKSQLEDESKVSHLSYIGDARIGERTNIGCGTITVNYDGKNKFRTEIGKDAFIGCNANLVAPVKIGDRSFIAAGSTVTDEVPDDSLAIARNRQTTKEGYYKNSK